MEIVVSSMVSDSHTWNLIYLQLLLEELGHRVVNLGACIPDAVLTAKCCQLQPGLIVLSSVNGHGYQDGLYAVEALRAQPALAETPIIIGGKLGTGSRDPHLCRELVLAGFDAVFDDDFESLAGFLSFLRALSTAVGVA